jgi:ATP-dependent DNA helicase RecG
VKQKALNNLSAPVRYLKGIGEKRGAALNEIGVDTVGDLLYYFPRRYLDRSNITRMNKLQVDETVTAVGKIVSKGIKRGRRSRFVLLLSDSTGFLTCVWFHHLPYWDKLFSMGETLAVSGKIGYYGGFQIIHPEFDRLSGEDDDNEDQFLNTGMIIPLYPSTEKLSKFGFDSRGFRRVIRQSLRTYGADIQETLSEALKDKHTLIPLPDALRAIHFPEDFRQLSASKNRLKFDELFYLQLLLAYRKRSMSLKQKGIAFEVVGEKTVSLVDKLPYKLTGAQRRVLGEIRNDMKRPHPMYRLLQGDVGSGKTVVALISMLMAVENGYQAALMAPTEILAEQHYLTIHGLLEELGVNVKLLIGGQKKSERDEIIPAIEDGTCQIVVGTHALIQEGVNFSRLGLVIIDEQHRFGVMQRASLMEKGLFPDVLVMTATPIPRTMTLTLYGDLDVSVIDEMPEGRLPVKTSWRTSDKQDKIYAFAKDLIDKGAQAYIVFPLVEESEKMDLQAATESYEKLKSGLFSDVRIALIHGRMKSDEKDAAMASFKSGETRVLISTTVIEVGVDVPNATVMIIEHAERFGLTQLHQLRGRVGRGSEQSYCILIAQPSLTDEARIRLNTISETTDGFKIAEADLKLRGPGEFFGTRQHGMPELLIANPVEDTELLVAARNEAFALVQDDPQLLKVENRVIHDTFLRKYKDKLDMLRAG